VIISILCLSFPVGFSSRQFNARQSHLNPVTDSAVTSTMKRILRENEKEKYGQVL
jgi:hypothetical protein